MTDWPKYLTESEQARLEQIDAALDALKRERRQLAGRARQRKFKRSS